MAVTLPVETAQTLAARAIREEKNLEQLLAWCGERIAVGVLTPGTGSVYHLRCLRRRVRLFGRVR